MSESVLTNARMVLPDAVMHGTLCMKDGIITDVSEGKSAVGEDVGGDYIIPGLIELHTDHLETHYSPRPGVRWNLTSAIQSHDAQIAASGITTVFDCLRLGSVEDDGFAQGEMRAMSAAISAAQTAGRLRAEHRIHLRCEVSAPNVLDHFAEFENDATVGLLSLMDHAPGQRQFQTMDQYILYYQKQRGLTDAQFDAFCAYRINQSTTYSHKHRAALARACHDRAIAVASHDDATLEHVEESNSFGVSVAEFPTSFAAAKASHDAGMGVLMGAPNVVRGSSHSGNIAAQDLAQSKVLDILSSDYVPSSLICAPFVLADLVDHLSLPAAIAMVSHNPAKQVGLDDRGALIVGRRADIIRVTRPDDDVPIVRSVWRQGIRVC